MDEDAVLVWTEQGGKPVLRLPAPECFNSERICRSVAQQLGGSIACDWLTERVIVTPKMLRK